MGKNNDVVEMPDIAKDKKNKKRKSVDPENDLESSIMLELMNGVSEKKKKKKKKEAGIETPTSESEVNKKSKKVKLNDGTEGISGSPKKSKKMKKERDIEETPNSAKKVKLDVREEVTPMKSKKMKKDISFIESFELYEESPSKSKKVKKDKEASEIKIDTPNKSKKDKKDVRDKEATEFKLNKNKKDKNTKEIIESEDDQLSHSNVDTPNKKKKLKKNKLDLDDDTDDDEIKMTVENNIDDELLEDTEDSKSKNSDITFPYDDLPTLIENIESLLPKKDNLSCKTRGKKIDWEKVAFNGYNALECKKTWEIIMKKQRHYRYMTEILADVKEWLKKLKNTHNNHPDFPKKKPLSGYMIYYVEQQNQILKEKPGLRMVDRSRIIAESYKQLSDKDKKKYIQLAAQRKALYELEVLEFFKKYPDLRNSDTGKPPKKPVTPFTLYMEDAQNKVRTGEEEEEVTKNELKIRWKLLSDDTKLVWIDKAVDLQINFLKDVKKYKTDHPDYNISVKQILTKEEKQLVDKRNGKPDKPPTTAYMLFVKKCHKKYQDEIANLSSKDRQKFCSQKWQELSPEDRRKYQAKLDALTAKFKTDNAAYLDSLPDFERELEIKNTPKKLRDNPLDKLTMADMATPECWDEMPESEKNVYLNYISKIKKFFDKQHGLTDEDNDEEEDEEEEQEVEEDEESN